MKKWEYEAIAEASNATSFDCNSKLCEWTELSEALSANGLSLPAVTSMRAVREICRLILSERKTTDVIAEQCPVPEIQSELLEREIYANSHDIAECYRNYCNDFSHGCLTTLSFWDDADHIGPVDYIAARVSK